MTLWFCNLELSVSSLLILFDIDGRYLNLSRRMLGEYRICQPVTFRTFLHKRFSVVREISLEATVIQEFVVTLTVKL
jgi:hypothetical protein